MTKRVFWLLLAAVTTLTLGSCTLELPVESCEPNEVMCEGEVYYKCLLSGEGYEEVVCGVKPHLGPFCHVEHVCVVCNNDSDCNSDEQHCVEHACRPLTVKACVEGTTKCKNSKVYTCINKALENAVLCPDGCNIDGTDCVSPDETCDEDTTQCTSDGKLATCINNRWRISDCGDGLVCPSDKLVCEDEVCREGELACGPDNNVSISCINNTLVEVACEGTTPVCEFGQCVACINGSKRCENNAVEHCVGNVWTIETACGNKSCSDKSYSCVVVECEANWQRCNNNIVEQCNAERSYEAMTPAACSTGTYCLENADTHKTTCVQCKTNAHCKDIKGAKVCHSDNTCVACTVGDSECLDDKTLLTCDANGAWPKEGTACSTGKECLVGATECTAISGYCTTNADCKNVLYPECNDKTNLCSCQNGQTACKLEGDKGKLSTCVNHTWVNETLCDPKTPLCNAAGTACVECTQNTDCKDGNICDVAAGKCKADPACTNDAIVCDAKRALTCSAGKWVGETCSNLCVTNVGCADCMPGTKKCEADKLRTCNASGQWGAGAACPKGQECLDGKTACTEIPVVTCNQGTDADKCEGKTHMTCVDTNWVSTPCTGATAVCDPAKGCVACTTNSHCTVGDKLTCNTSTNTCVTCINASNKCTNNSSKIGQLQSCADENWSTATACANNSSCKNTTSCGVCQNDTSQCIDLRDKRTCVSGAWGAGTSCAYGCDPGTNNCKPSPKPSSIAWCKTISIDSDSKIAYGRVIDSRDPPDHLTISANFLCGKAGQTIETYHSLNGTYNENCTDCFLNYEYTADLRSLSAGEYLCMWVFTLDSELPAVCQTNGDVVKTPNYIPTASTALQYTVKDLVFKYLIDFETFLPNEDYANIEELIDGDITTTVNAAIHQYGLGSIENNTVVIGDSKDGSIVVHNSGTDTYIGTLHFTIKTWGEDLFKSDVEPMHTVDFVYNSKTTRFKLDLEPNNTYTAEMVINNNVKDFTIKKTMLLGEEKPRLLIDNIRWTNH